MNYFLIFDRYSFIYYYNPNFSNPSLWNNIIHHTFSSNYRRSFWFILIFLWIHFWIFNNYLKEINSKNDSMVQSTDWTYPTLWPKLKWIIDFGSFRLETLTKYSPRDRLAHQKEHDKGPDGGNLDHKLWTSKWSNQSISWPTIYRFANKWKQHCLSQDPKMHPRTKLSWNFILFSFCLFRLYLFDKWKENRKPHFQFYCFLTDLEKRVCIVDWLGSLWYYLSNLNGIPHVKV